MAHLEPRNVTDIKLIRYTDNNCMVSYAYKLYQNYKRCYFIADYFLTNILYFALILVRSKAEFTPISFSTLSSACRRRSPSMPHFWKVAEYLSSLYFVRKSSTVCRGCFATLPSSLRWNRTWKYTRSEISDLIGIAQDPADWRTAGPIFCQSKHIAYLNYGRCNDHIRTQRSRILSCMPFGRKTVY